MTSERTSDDAGFTLVEVMVVVLIIGILLSIAVPTFIGASGRAHDRNVQTNLTAITKSISYAVWEGNIAAVTHKELNNQEVLPNIVFRSATAQSHDQTEISVSTSSEVFMAASRSESGECFFVRMFPDGTITKGTKDTGYCSANNTSNVSADGW